jgi:hypothetical protein
MKTREATILSTTDCELVSEAIIWILSSGQWRMGNVRNEMDLLLLSPIDGDGLFGIRPPARADNAGQFVDIKGHMPKGDPKAGFL